MKDNVKYTLMVAGMVLSWSIYYAVSKVVVDATGSARLAGFFLRLSALVFLTIQLLADGSFKRLFHQGKAVLILITIGVFGFLLDLFANLGYAGGSLSTGTALLKTDVLMVNLATVALYHKRLYFSDWLGTGIMLIGVLLVLGVDFGGMTLHVTDLYFLLSAACVSANAFIIKAAQEKYHAHRPSLCARSKPSAAPSAATSKSPWTSPPASGGLWPWADLPRRGSTSSTTATSSILRCGS